MNPRHLGILTLALVVTGCSSMPDDAPADPPSTGGSHAVGPVNLWRVSDAAGESADTWLRLDIGCEGAPVPGWFAMARRAAADGAVLVLLGQDGTEPGRLTRS